MGEADDTAGASRIRLNHGQAEKTDTQRIKDENGLLSKLYDASQQKK